MMDLQKISEDTLVAMQAAGFDACQVVASISNQDELNLAHNSASLLRSTEDHQLSLTGIVDQRRASTEISDFSDEGIAAAVKTLFENTLLAPQDEANHVSADQVLSYTEGPVEGDLDLLAEKVSELLAFRQAETPLMQLDEGSASHNLTRTRILTSAGTAIDSSVGAYSLSVMGSASEDGKSSSFNYTGGSSNDLSEQHAAAYFGIEEMLRSTEGQIETRSLDENFTGDVVLTPPAVSDLLAWLVGQLGDMQLISGNSLYRNSVGELIASPLLSLSSRFDGPGLLPVSADGCVAAPLDVIYEGRLMNLLPSLYGSRKTGLAHRPSADGWRISHGDTPRAELCDGIEHGALVGRLSMGRPATNGDFSGVIKSSTEIVDGKQTDALSEVMISGNMASMLKDITAVSRETLDTGSEDLPWIRIQGLNFS